MKKHLHLLLGLVTCCLLVQAQTQTRLDLRTYKRLVEGKISKGNLPLLVKGDLTKVRELVKKYDGVFKYNYGNIASVEIPEQYALDFARENGIDKIENTNAKGVALMDTARIVNNIDSAQAGYAPLHDSLLGKHVIIGIIDGGIYWRHRDFQNPDGTTRIKYIWDQAVTGTNIPLPYNYGNQWSWVDLDNGNCTHTDPANDFSHGTCVAGIAAGNSLSTDGTPYQGQLTGVAPQADIIAVRLLNDTGFLTHIADACDYIFKKAYDLGEPCVINISQGTYYGSRDGIDLPTRLMENMLAESNGRVIVAAAGNAGNVRYHLSYNLPADSNNAGYTFFSYSPNVPGEYFDFWADTANFADAFFTVGCNDSLGIDLGKIDYINILRNFTLTPGVATIINRPLFFGNLQLGNIAIAITLDEGRYHVEFLITPGKTSYLWRLQMYGTGKFDLWSSSALIGSSDMVDYLPGSIFIQYPNYHHPDSLKTLVSSFQCSDKIITVGNYSNRAGYLDRDSVYVDLTDSANGAEVVGKIFKTSSLGPTRDGRMKPDVVATGSTIICTGDSTFIAQATSPANRVKVYITKKHARNGGTSMSSPLVAGIAALYLQKRPTATAEEIKDVLIWTAKRDSFTGPNANYTYGNGKVDAFRALTYAGIVYGSADTACINYNAGSNVDSGCVVKIYGCTDTAALNYDSTANVSAGNCIYTVDINKIVDAPVNLHAVPNPFSGQTTFVLVDNGFAFNKGEIEITDQLGRTVQILNVTINTQVYNFDAAGLANGIYYYTLKLDGKKIKTGKLVAQ